MGSNSSIKSHTSSLVPMTHAGEPLERRSRVPPVEIVLEDFEQGDGAMKCCEDIQT